MAMILEYHAFGVPESFSDMLALVGIESDTTKSSVYPVIVVESAYLSEGAPQKYF